MLIPKLDLQLFSEDVTEVVDTTPEVEYEAEETSDELQDDNVEETEEQPENKFEFEVQYNKEKKIINDPEELRTYAQKGMNYDKIQSRLEQLESDPLRQWANDYMKKVGYDDPSKFIADVQKEQAERDFNNRVQEFVAKGYAPDVAREMAELKKENQEIKSQIQGITQKTEQQKEYEDFINWHNEAQQQGLVGELKADEIPLQVWEAQRRGIPLKYAYMEYILPNIKLQTEQNTLKNLQKNAETSTGSTKDGGNNENGNWSREYIEQMANSHGQGWVKQNFDKIEKSGYFD